MAGILRSIDAANRRAIRNQERHGRLEQRRLALQAKIDEYEAARLETEEYEERVNFLLSVHREEPTVLDWNGILNAPVPQAPERSSAFKTAATAKLKAFAPSFLDKILRRTQKKIQVLQQEVMEAKKRDDLAFASAEAAFRANKQGDARRKELAKAILDGTLEAYREATEFICPLGDMIEAGCEAEVSFPDRFTVEVCLTVEGDSVVPKTIKGITKTGKLTTKDMPLGRFNELYQDYVCGMALRTGREFFAFLPVARVVATISTHMLNSVRGTQELTPVLSVLMPRETFEQIDFEHVDPSDSMKLFIHRMGFKKSQGFIGISRLEKEEYPPVEVCVP